MKYQLENWESYYKDCQELWQEYYAEVSVDHKNLELSMDVDKYKTMEEAGILKIITARVEGKLVGFFMGMLTTHLHYKDSLCGFQDLLFLSKEYRKGSNGIKLVAVAEQEFKKQGAQYLFFASHPNRNSGKLLSYLGFAPNDTTYIKFIG